MGERRKRVAFVSSIGGHLAELLELSSAFEECEQIWILNDRSPVWPKGREVHVISHAERDWKVLWNVVELAAILSRERPELVVSTGAGPAVPAALVARLAGVPFIHIEPSSAVKAPTLTGRILQWVTPHIYVQWESLAARLRGARYVGGLL
jgi:UDP-N-acetylglucosamine:LPS N-acetylglucosamine transferase